MYRSLIYVCFFLLLSAGCTSEFTFNNTKTLANYPSGSGLAFFHNKIYLIGDDANSLLILDTAFNILDSIRLFDSDKYREPKELKHDLEGATMLWVNKLPHILLVGSGSLSPYRSMALLVNVVSKDTVHIDLKPFYSRVKKERIEALNIEGVSAIPNGIVLASRGNRSLRENYLIFTSTDFWKQDSAEIKICKVGTNTDTASFQGVSGLEYSKVSDQLLLTVSTENTYSSTDDGTIGKSYLWIINNISAKKNMIAVNPNKIIDLEEMDERFKGHKIESVCIIAENNKQMQLALVADDDKGTSILFRITLKK